MIVPSRRTSGLVAVTWPSVRSGSGVVNTSSVGRFGKWRKPSAVVKSAAHHVCVGSIPTRQLRPRPAQLDRVETKLAESPGRIVESVHAVFPRLDRIGLVETQHVLELTPQLFVRLLPAELRIDELAPFGMRARDDAPVGRAIRDDLAELPHPGQHVFADEVHVEPVEHVRRDDPLDRHATTVLLRVGEHPAPVPLRDEVERVGIRMLDAGALDPGVEVADVDEFRAAVVGRCGDCTRQLLLAELGGDQHDLARLDVRAVNGEIGETCPAITHEAGDPIARGEHHGVTLEAATERFLAAAGISDGTRRVYAADLREFAHWFGPDSPVEDIDVRVLADWVTELGRARPGGRLAPATIGRKLTAVRSLLRFALGPERVPDGSFAPKRPRRLPDAPKQSEVEDIVDALGGDGPLALRNQALVELVYSAGLRSAEAVGLDLGDVDFEQELVHVRLGKGGKDRVVPLGEEAASLVARYRARGATAARARRRERALPLDAWTPARHFDLAPTRPASTSAAARLRHAPAAGRRRPPHDPGAARALITLDHPDVQPRRRKAIAKGL